MERVKRINYLGAILDSGGRWEKDKMQYPCNRQ
jgi:hypothetical protein